MMRRARRALQEQSPAAQVRPPPGRGQDHRRDVRGVEPLDRAQGSAGARVTQGRRQEDGETFEDIPRGDPQDEARRTPEALSSRDIVARFSRPPFDQAAQSWSTHGMTFIRPGLTGVMLSGALAAVIVSGTHVSIAADEPAQGAASTARVPSFRVDPTWPQELPNKWILGAVTGVFVDAKDHVWVTHLPETLTEEETSLVQKPPIATCCAPAPTVLEFDAQGKIVQGWGEPTQDIAVYPRNPHGIFVDHNDFV